MYRNEAEQSNRLISYTKIRLQLAMCLDFSENTLIIKIDFIKMLDF